MDSKLKSYLAEYRINYKLHCHPKVFTVLESRKTKELEKIPGIRTKSLFLKDENNEFYLITLEGDRKLYTKEIKILFKIKEMHFASPEEMKKELKTTPGSVSPFSILNSFKTKLIIDNRIYNSKVIQCHPDNNSETLELKRKDFQKFINSIIPNIKLFALNCSKQAQDG